MTGRDNSASSFLNCPRCGLGIKPRAPGLTVEHCPRCMALARIPVKLFASPLPPSELHPPGAAPGDLKRSLKRRPRPQPW
jgi:uncharacterized C2H2 Zn-finger protein